MNNISLFQIQKKASEKFLATIERWADSIEKFELYMNRIENYMPTTCIKPTNNGESDTNILKVDF